MKAGRESHRWPNTDSVGARLSAYSDNLRLEQKSELDETIIASR
jgi:hypothetical protein